MQRIARNIIASGYFLGHLDKIQREGPPNAPGYAQRKGNTPPLERTGALKAALGNPNSALWKIKIDGNLIIMSLDSDAYNWAQQRTPSGVLSRSSKMHGKFAKASKFSGALNHRRVIEPMEGDAAALAPIIMKSIMEGE